MFLILKGSWLLLPLLPADISSTCNHVPYFLKNSTLSHGNLWHPNSCHAPSFHRVFHKHMKEAKIYARCSMWLAIKQMKIKTKPISFNTIRSANFKIISWIILSLLKMWIHEDSHTWLGLYIGTGTEERFCNKSQVGDNTTSRYMYVETKLQSWFHYNLYQKYYF